MKNIKTIPLYSENNDFQHIFVLKHNRNKRHHYKEFFVEGVRNINLMLENNWTVECFIYCEEKPLSSWAQNIISHSKAKAHFMLTSSLMKKLSDKEETSELLAIVKMPEDDFERLKPKDSFNYLIFDRPVYPGNLGTVIRSADAFKADGILITGHAADLYDPATIRASMGSFFTVPCIRMTEQKVLEEWINKLKITYPDLGIIGTSAKADKWLFDYSFGRQNILIIGNETSGMSAYWSAKSDVSLKIPMEGSASSLNVGCAASIVLYELYKHTKLT